MNYRFYEYSLCLALGVMLFFAIYFFFAKTPEKPIFRNYLRSRRLVGAALLVLSVNYSIHLFFGLRFININAAILMNLSTYFLSVWLFGSALISLLNRKYLNRKLFIFHVLNWLAFTAACGIVLFVFRSAVAQKAGLLVMTVWFFVYSFFIVRRLVKTYRRAVKLFDETQSDHIGAYISWLSVFTWWAIIYGVGCGLLTFLPDKFVPFWIISSIPFYSYLYWSYMNYVLFYERVEKALDTDMEEDAPESGADGDMVMERPSYYTGISTRLEGWIRDNGYTKQGLTLEDLSRTLDTNRTYLSDYIRTCYGLSFREWITGLRIEYAKKELMQHPYMTVSAVSEEAGFMSLSYFTKIFTDKTGCSPAKWKKSAVSGTAEDNGSVL